MKEFNLMGGLLVTAAMVVLPSCSSVPKLAENMQNLSTRAIKQQYFYCESCNQPTELTTLEVKALEPDTPLQAAKPVVIANKQITISSKPASFQHKLFVPSNKKLHTRPQHRLHKHLSKIPKQCIKWSNT